MTESKTRGGLRTSMAVSALAHFANKVSAVKIPLVALLFVSLCSTACLGDPIAIDDIQRKDAVSFQKEILPILQKNCLACHSASEKQGNLVLESPQGMMAGGDTGPAAIPGRGSESLILTLASHADDPAMPPGDNDVAAKNLSPAELGLLRLWIDQGAKGSGGIDSLSPKQWHPLPAGVHPVQAIALTEDGQFVACSRANQIFLYHVPTGQLVTKLSDSSLATQHATGVAHQDFVQSLAFNVDGDLLASGGFRQVKLWRRPRDVQRLNLAVEGAAGTVAVSPDKQWIAAGDASHAIRFFKTSDGSPGPTLSGHTDKITSLRFSADGHTIVSGSIDKTVRFWNAADGKLQTTIETPAAVNAIALINRELPTDQVPQPAQYLVTGNAEKQIHVWELPDPLPATISEPAKEIAAHSKAVTSLQPDSQRLRHVYSGSLDGTVQCWNLDSGRSIRRFNHGGPVAAIAISPDGQRVASASENARARLFRSSGQQIAELRGDVRTKTSQTRAQQLLNSANARLNAAKRLLDEAEKDVPKKTEAEKKLAGELATANTEAKEKQVAVDKALAEKIAVEKAAIDASTTAKSALADKEQAELVAKGAATAMKVAQGKMAQLQQALAASPDSDQLKQLIATAQQDLTTCQQKSQELTSAVKVPTQKAQEMATAANAAAQKVNDVQKPYNDATSALKTAKAKQNLLAQQHALAAAESKQAQELMPVRKQTYARAEQAKADAEQAVAAAKEAVTAAEKPIRSIAFSPDGSVLATAGDFSNLHTWDGQTGEAIAAFAGSEGPTRQIVFMDSDAIVSAGDDKSVRVWELNPGWKLQRTIGDPDDSATITHRATAVDFTRDSKQLLVASGVPSRSGELHVFNVADGSRTVYLPHAHDDVIYSARFSPDGKRVASGGADKYLRTFDVATSQQLRRFEGHTNYVLGVSWKGDGETLATAAADNTIKLWEAETGDSRRTITQQLTKHVTAVQFIGDTDNVISSSGDKRVRIHNGNNGAIARNFANVQSWLHCVAATPDSKIVAAGDASGTVTLFNGTNGQVLRTLEAD